jgi:HSP20 family molecular chaperone IbpA
MAFDAVRGECSVTLYFNVPGISSDDLEVSVETRRRLHIRPSRCTRW